MRDELEALQKAYGSAKVDPRRTRIEAVEEVEYSADDFIVEEDNVVIVSRDGWVKRQKEVKDLAATRLREGDAVLAVLPGSTRATVVFFTNFGTAYTCRIVDVPASTGYGEPIQKPVQVPDGERVVAAFSLDPRVTPGITPTKEGDVPRDPRGGRDQRRLQPAVRPRGVRRAEHAGRPPLRAAVGGRRGRRRGEDRRQRDHHRRDRQARAMLCKVDEINFLSGPGKGVILIKLNADDDRVLGFIASTGDRDLLTVETSRGAEQTISTTKYEVTGRGGKGRELLQRGQFTRIVSAGSRGADAARRAGRS